ncbi:MAG: FkbM family methyltransferase [Pseudomonadota bacterium]
MPYTGSLYQPNTALLEAFNDLAEVARVAQVHDVSTVRLDDVADIEQGAELDVFIGGEKALQTAVLIQTEVAFVEDYRGAPLFADIDSHLRSRGFWFHTFLGFGSRTLRPMRHGAPGDPGTGVDRGLNQKLWSDAVYIKHPLQREKLSTSSCKSSPCCCTNSTNPTTSPMPA